MYSRATVHQVGVANVPANEYVSRVTENDGYSKDTSQKSATRVPVYQTTTKGEH